MKKVKRLLYAHQVDMGGIPVRQPIPTQQVDQIDPFLLLHHAQWEVMAGSNPRTTGVDPHPHRGFSPVTFVYRGSVHHRDSRGNSGLVHAGGVQWMHAGMGVIHSERPGKELAETGGTQEIIQLWINTPASDKMMQPSYLALQKEEIPSAKPDSGAGLIQVVSGELDGLKGKVPAIRPMLAVMGWLAKGASHKFSVQEGRSTLFYLLDGEVSVKGFGLVDGYQLIEFEKEGTDIEISATEDTRFLLISADPLKEPIAWQGPFVMNNETQILQAMRDYQIGKMGVLIEDFD